MVDSDRALNVWRDRVQAEDRFAFAAAVCSYAIDRKDKERKHIMGWERFCGGEWRGGGGETMLVSAIIRAAVHLSGSDGVGWTYDRPRLTVPAEPLAPAEYAALVIAVMDEQRRQGTYDPWTESWERVDPATLSPMPTAEAVTTVAEQLLTGAGPETLIVGLKLQQPYQPPPDEEAGCPYEA